MTEGQELPIGWVCATIGELAMAINPGFPSGKHNQEGKGVPHMRPMNINPRGEIDLTVLKYVEDDGHDVLLKDDILFNNTNSPGWLGKSAYIRHDTNWAYSNHMTRIRVVREYIDSAWVTYCLHTLFLKGYFQANCVHHVNQASIGTGFLSDKVFIPLPPLPEQRRIVAKVEELLTRLDAGVEALKKIQLQLKRYRQSVLKAAFSGELTAEWRKAHKGELETGSALLEKIKEQRKKNGKHKELSPLDTMELPKLPEGWVWARVGDICEKIHYGYTASADYTPAGPKMLRITDIQHNSVNWDTVPYCKIDLGDKPSYLLEDGDLLFARTGATVGKSYLIKGAIPEAVFASYLIRVILPTNIIKGYIYAFFQSLAYWLQIRQGQLGIGQPNVNSQTLSKITLPLAPLKEQERILDEIERCFSIADEIENTVEQSLRQSERLRQSILKKAFEGKLVPQNPDDEPAEKLLERIKVEKAKTRRAAINVR